MARVIGRLRDLEHRPPRAGERRLADDCARWSFAHNGAWLADGVHAGEPFLQVSTAAPGCVLAWEIARLRQLGCVRVGPFWVPRPWLHDRLGYTRLVRLVAEHLLSLPASGAPEFVPKALAELEPLLAMWPFVLLLPVSAPLSIEQLIAARAWPVHALGVMPRPAHADGRLCSPAEFFCHDVDHARFKVREDLLARGITIADPYEAGTTFDAAAGAHRSVMPAARPHVDAHGWRHAARRARVAAGWIAAIAAEPDRALGEAARWLLFELVHEKSLPIDGAVLGAALATDAHARKLRAKCVAGFHAANGPSPAAVARLCDARAWLRSLCERGP